MVDVNIVASLDHQINALAILPATSLLPLLGTALVRLSQFGIAIQYIRSSLFCTDVNECEATPDVCDSSAICLNTYGSYKCLTLMFGGLSSGKG
jgi:hypothetical protein